MKIISVNTQYIKKRSLRIINFINSLYYSLFRPYCSKIFFIILLLIFRHSPILLLIKCTILYLLLSIVLLNILFISLFKRLLLFEILYIYFNNTFSTISASLILLFPIKKIYLLIFFKKPIINFSKSAADLIPLNTPKRMGKPNNQIKISNSTFGFFIISNKRINIRN